MSTNHVDNMISTNNKDTTHINSDLIPDEIKITTLVMQKKLMTVSQLRR